MSATSTTQFIPPRSIHNQKLAKEWLSKNNITACFPKVSDQLPTVPVNRYALSSFGYNPSLIRFSGRWLMAYRWHPDHTPRTILGMAELDDNFNVFRNMPLRPPGQHAEDPRLFIFQNDLWASYVESKWPDELKSVVKLGKVVERADKSWAIVDVLQPNYRDNDGQHTEKNWAFFEWQSKLLLLYSAWPEQIIAELDPIDMSMKQEWCTPGKRWAYGEPRAGVAPHGKLRFFHSRLDNEAHPYRWRYYLGVAMVNPEPPFETISISPKPLAIGSEDDDLGNSERTSARFRKPNVIFPGSVVETKAGWLVSVGINDCECALLKIPHESLPSN